MLQLSWNWHPSFWHHLIEHARASIPSRPPMNEFVRPPRCEACHLLHWIHYESGLLNKIGHFLGILGYGLCHHIIKLNFELLMSISQTWLNPSQNNTINIKNKSVMFLKDKSGLWYQMRFLSLIIKSQIWVTFSLSFFRGGTVSHSASSFENN